MGIHLDEPSSPVSPVISPVRTPVSPVISPVRTPDSPVLSPVRTPVTPVPLAASPRTSGSLISAGISSVKVPVSQVSPVKSPVRYSDSSSISPAKRPVSPVSPITSASRLARSRDVVTMRHGVIVTRIPNNELENTSILLAAKPHNRRDMEGLTTQKSISTVVKQTERLSLHGPCNKTDKRYTEEIEKYNRLSRTRPRQSLPATVTLCVGKDEDLDVGRNSDLFKGLSQEYLEDDSKESFYEVDKELPHVDTEESSEEEISETDNVEFTLSSETEGRSAKCVKLPKEKDSRKKKFHSLLPALKRSQSLGCDSNLVTEDAGGSKQCAGQLSRDKLRETSDVRRMIHKTCSADATMMASDVLPIDPQEFMKNKQKSSIARNMRKKFQKLKRRNTDSLLGAAILSVRGSPKITQSSAIEWATSFEALLTDKNGMEMFKSFLKSEFSEENIEFWSACEEFKTVRTNKLVSRAQKIYSDFIAIKAPKQVNLDSKTRLETVTNLENPTRDMFKDAQKRIQFLMENDSYKRFIDSDAYKHLIRRNSTADGR